MKETVVQPKQQEGRTRLMAYNHKNACLDCMRLQCPIRPSRKGHRRRSGAGPEQPPAAHARTGNGSAPGRIQQKLPPCEFALRSPPFLPPCRPGTSHQTQARFGPAPACPAAGCICALGPGCLRVPEHRASRQLRPCRLRCQKREHTPELWPCLCREGTLFRMFSQTLTSICLMSTTPPQQRPLNPPL